MMKTDELFAEAVMLPPDVRTQLIDKLLQSLNPTRTNIEELWAAESESRIDAFDAGQLTADSIDTVLGRISKQ